MSNLEPHLLQTSSWGEFKSHFGWKYEQVSSGPAQAQILFRGLPFGLSIAYIPRGPVLDWTDSATANSLFEQIHQQAQKRRAIFLKVEPNSFSNSLHADEQPAVRFLRQQGFAASDAIQPRTSALIDISKSEDEILAAMKQKTRYNIRLAGRKGITVRLGTIPEVQIFHRLSQITAERDGFGIHNLRYYQMALRVFAPERAALLLAEFEGQPLAALMVFRHGAEAYYFYGASSNEHRNRMPTYLLQWEAIRWAKEHGSHRYDLWGLPDAEAETLEAEFQQRRDGLWGVYRFKRGFGGQVVHTPGSFDYVYLPWWYRLYQWWRGRSEG